MTPELKSVLTEVYEVADTPADQLLTNPDLADRFMVMVGERMGRPVERCDVLRQLLSLRKKGRLPRLRR